ncbi:Plasmodium variant antigen protein Cir/Yir/Bir, putative, partial [Plasmodium chabaudi chabaudi]
MAYAVCGAINVIEKLITVKEEDSRVYFYPNHLLKAYCNVKERGTGVCFSYAEIVSSAVLFLLKLLEIDYHYEDDLKNAKLAEYAILWLSYKLNKYSQKGITKLNDFYTQHIEKNKYYNVEITKSSDKKTYKDIIDRKHDLMNISCGAINVIEKLITVKEEDSRVYFYPNHLLKAYCNVKERGTGVCFSYAEIVSSAVLFLLKLLEIDYHYEDDLKNAKLAEYAILWLSYKLNKYSQKGITKLNDFYTQHIEKNKYYNVEITKSSDKKTYKD